MSVIRELATFVTGASVASLPEHERAIQRRHVADALLAAVAGSRTAEGRSLRPVFPRPELADAAGVIAATIRQTEIDDIHLRSCTTPSSVVVPVALALARDAQNFDPERVASAIWVGIELMTRLGVAADGPKNLYRGVWPTYLAAPLGAAAVAARMWGLEEDKTAHALSLAFMLMSGRSGRFQGAIPGRWFVLAIAVAAGVRAAAAARAGIGGDPDLLDGPWLRDAHGLDVNLDTLRSGLGTGSVYPNMTLKPFCSAKQAIASIEALITLLDEGLSPDAVTQVRVRVPPPYWRMISTKAEVGARASTFVSAAFQLGLAARWRERLYDIERSELMQNAAVRAFADKVEIVADETLGEFFPARWPAEVEVAADGKTLRKRITDAIGDPARPLDDAQLRDKAERVLRLLPGAPAATGVIDLGLAGLREAAACRQMADMMWTACLE